MTSPRYTSQWARITEARTSDPPCFSAQGALLGCLPPRKISLPSECSCFDGRVGTPWYPYASAVIWSWDVPVTPRNGLRECHGWGRGALDPQLTESLCRSGQVGEHYNRWGSAHLGSGLQLGIYSPQRRTSVFSRMFGYSPKPPKVCTESLRAARGSTQHPCLPEPSTPHGPSQVCASRSVVWGPAAAHPPGSC